MPVFGSREVAYGNYDRIQVTPVEHLYDFTRVANQTHDWLGSNQSILLYKWKDGIQNRCFQAKKEASGRTKIVVLDEDGEPREKEFSAVTFCYLSDSIRSRTKSSYEGLLDQCERNICDLVKAFNTRVGALPEGSVHNPVAAEVFGSLSAAEVVILWSAKQYTDVMYLIDCVRDFECRWREETLKLFRTTYTLITFPDAVSRDDNINCWDDMRQNSKDCKLKEVKGEAQIMFATQDGAGEETFEAFKAFFDDCIQNASEMLDECSPPKYELIPCAGEYDLLVKVPSKYVTRLFCNPKIWHGEESQNPQWTPDPEAIHDAACSVFHPTFNQYILYSFTRLTYKKNEDLPEFARGGNQEWENERKRWCSVENVDCTEDQHNRTKPTDVFKRDLDLLNLLLEIVREQIPLNSNLSMELNQLFNDYAQCMCASADGLWIADYRELYKQILEQLSLIIRQMHDRERDEWEEHADMDSVKLIENFNDLILALHRQTNHITTSSKQLFREQETHFGYTAQHDLVLHAYYDMVKHLMQVIYSYSDKSFQSPLYPLVNFRPGDHIKSFCYFEEGAKSYLKAGANKYLRSRVIVFEVPLDGMDNLMYYIPMMVHEVFHYAAPRNRQIRNQLLTKLSVYLALDHSLTSIFSELFRARLAEAEAQHRNPEQLQLVLRNAEVQFRDAVTDSLRCFVDTHLEQMYESVKATFFTAELNSLNADPNRSKLEELQSRSILRGWFVVWLKNWLCGDGETAADNGGTAEHRGLDDFFEPLFRMLSDELPRRVKQDLNDVSEDKRFVFAVYNNVIDQIKEQIDAVLHGADEPSTDKDAINQRLMMGVRDYIGYDQESPFRDQMKQLDEIFPDIAMTTLTKMPASGYMLQIALDLDKKMHSCNIITMNDIRFAAVLHWLVSRQSKMEGKSEREYLNQELRSFQKLYCSSYQINALASGSKEKDNHEDDDFSGKANRWSNAFRDACIRYSANAPTRGMIGWMNTQISEQMIPCLQMEEDTEENLRIKDSLNKLFENPYNQYLKLLREKEVGEELLGELFRLSIQTILRFQRHQSLKWLNEVFQKKSSMAQNDGGERRTSTDSKRLNIYQDAVAVTLTAPENLLKEVQHAVNLLYQFREEANVPTSTTGMWYRGVSNATHTALPSGFVHFAEDAGKLDGGLKNTSAFTYLDAQRHNYETFRYSAEGSTPDVSPAQYQCTVNYLALMQHYSQHTNLMDWSEDFFAATYFALEEQIKLNDCYRHEREEKIKKGLKDADQNAALYILDPVRFNRACRDIENDMSLFALSISSPDGTLPVTQVPNLSIPENQEQMREYHELYPNPANLPMPLRRNPYSILSITRRNQGGNALSPVTLTDIKNNCRVTEKLPMHLPRAVYAAKLNARIRAQSGLFIAYSLLSPPVVWEGADIVTDKTNTAPFHYLGLEQIQEYYLQMDRSNRPFLLKVELPSGNKNEWGKIFYRFGLSTERIYPELQNNRNR